VIGRIDPRAFWLLLAVVASAALGQVPSTDIFVVSIDDGGVGDVKRVTNRDAYDNQPMFLPPGERLVFSSMGTEGTDIRLYDFASGKTERLVETPQSEYSPTPIPGREAISLVRDYGDQKQQLWAFPLDGGEPELLLPDVNPVGYHAWVDNESLILFVLGEPMTLQYARVGPGTGKILAEFPGRALGQVPGSNEMSFVDKAGESWWITAIDPSSGKKRRLMPTLEACEDYAWAPDGAVWMGKASRLYRRQLDDDSWQPVADLADHGVHEITRLSFSPDGKLLALVGRHAAAD
jgi:hypothetical protein